MVWWTGDGMSGPVQKSGISTIIWSYSGSSDFGPESSQSQVFAEAGPGVAQVPAGVGGR